MGPISEIDMVSENDWSFVHPSALLQTCSYSIMSHYLFETVVACVGLRVLGFCPEHGIALCTLFDV